VDKNKTHRFRERDSESSVVRGDMMSLLLLLMMMMLAMPFFKDFAAAAPTIPTYSLTMPRTSPFIKLKLINYFQINIFFSFSNSLF